MAILYIIATPIGNLGDITYRAVKTLFSVDVLLCEDTRTTLRLLEHYRQNNEPLPKLIAYHEHNEDQKLVEVIKLLKQNQNIGLVSDAGTPLISDPGYKLVRLCQKKGFTVISVPGPSAVIAALSISGLPTDKFTFLGFLPKKAAKQIKLFEQIQLSQLAQTVVFYESPHRIQKSLQSIVKVYGDIEVTVVRELTKIYEAVTTQKISSIDPDTAFRGELVVLFSQTAS